MGCVLSTEGDDPDAPTPRLVDNSDRMGMIASDTKKSQSHTIPPTQHRSRKKEPSQLSTKETEGGGQTAGQPADKNLLDLPTLDKQASNSLSLATVVHANNGGTDTPVGNLSRQGTAGNLKLPPQDYRHSPSLGAVPEPSTTPHGAFLHQPLASLASYSALSSQQPLSSLATSGAASPQPLTPPAGSIGSGANRTYTPSPNRGPLGELRARERSTRTPREKRGTGGILNNGGAADRSHSNSPTPDAMGLDSSPRRLKELSNRTTPILDLRGRARLARELDGGGPEMDISPRLSARLSQTANIRQSLARQQSNGLAVAAVANGNNPTALQTITALNQAGAAPIGDWMTESASNTSSASATTSTTNNATESDNPRRNGMTLNPRRQGSDISIDSVAILTTNSPSLTQQPPQSQYPPSPVLSHSSMRSSGQVSISGFSQAIDLIDATVPPSQGQDLSARSRHSMRASRHSLGPLPFPVPGASNGPDSYRRNTGRNTGRGRGRRMALVVDSNTLNQRLNVAALSRAGFHSCDVASEGETAMSMTQATHYELILMDAQLNTLSCVETVNAIRFFENQNGEPPTTILVLHPNLMGDMDKFRLAHVNGVLQKGCIIADAIVEALTSLAKNPNFILISANGTKTQDPRTEAQEQAEIAAAFKVEQNRLMRGSHQQPLSQRSPGGSPILTSSAGISPTRGLPTTSGFTSSSPYVNHEGAVPVVRSNRRTTSSGRMIPTTLLRKPSHGEKSGDLTPSPAPGSQSSFTSAASSANMSQSMGGGLTPIQPSQPTQSQVDSARTSSPSGSPSPLGHSPKSTKGSLLSLSSNNSPPPTITNTLMVTTSVGSTTSSSTLHPSPPTSATSNSPPTPTHGTFLTAVKPRRASLSIHSLKDLQPRSSPTHANNTRPQPGAQ